MILATNDWHIATDQICLKEKEVQDAKDPEDRVRKMAELEIQRVVSEKTSEFLLEIQSKEQNINNVNSQI